MSCRQWPLSFWETNQWPLDQWPYCIDFIVPNDLCIYNLGTTTLNTTPSVEMNIKSLSVKETQLMGQIANSTNFNVLTFYDSDLVQSQNRPTDIRVLNSFVTDVENTNPLLTNLISAPYFSTDMIQNLNSITDIENITTSITDLRGTSSLITTLCDCENC